MSGRDKGEEVRKLLELDTKDRDTVRVTIRVPPKVLSLNSSFFLGLFGASVKDLGIARFDAKYHFECSSPLILEDVDRGKREALIESNPLPNV